MRSVSGLMKDKLRTKGVLPVQHPYTGAPFNHAGGEEIKLELAEVSGNDAIVDWLLLELRAAADPLNIVATKAFMVQRDGDLMDAPKRCNRPVIPWHSSQ